MAARAALTVQAVVIGGLVETFASADSSGNSVPGDGDTVLHVKNGSGSSINVTIVTGGTFHGQSVSDEVIAVAAGAEALIGRFKPALFNDPTTGLVNIDYSAVTSVTVAAIGI